MLRRCVHTSSVGSSENPNPMMQDCCWKVEQCCTVIVRRTTSGRCALVLAQQRTEFVLGHAWRMASVTRRAWVKVSYVRHVFGASSDKYYYSTTNTNKSVQPNLFMLPRWIIIATESTSGLLQSVVFSDCRIGLYGLLKLASQTRQLVLLVDFVSLTKCRFDKDTVLLVLLTIASDQQTTVATSTSQLARLQQTRISQGTPLAALTIRTVL